MPRVTPALALIGLASLVSVGLWRLGSTSKRGGVPAVEAAAGSSTRPRHGDVGGLRIVQALDESAADSAAGSSPGDRRELTAAERQPTPQRATVVIEVHGLLGPAAGAVVVPHTRFYARRPAGEGEPQPADPTAEFTTDENGHLILEVAPSTQSTLLFTWPTSSWQQQITWTSPKREATKVLKVRFPLAPEDMALQVRSFPSGAAIEGAHAAIGSASTYTIPKDGSESRSNRLGLLRVPATQGLTRDPYIVTVVAEGHSSARVNSAAPDPLAQTTVWLPEFAQLSGVVALSNGHAEVVLAPRSAVREAVAPKGLEESQAAALFMANRHISGVDLETSQVRVRANVGLDGRWSMPSVRFESRDDTLDDYVLVVSSALHGRLLADDLFVSPGDELVFEDPLLKGPRLELNFLLADGRQAFHAGAISFSRAPAPGFSAESSADRVNTIVDRTGSLSFAAFPPGTWEWRLQTPEAAGEPTGTFLHGSAEPTRLTVKLEGHTDLEGRVVGKRLLNTRVYWHVAGEPETSFGTNRTSDKGDFRIPLLPVGCTLRLLAVTSSIQQLSTGEEETAPNWSENTVTVTVDGKGLRDVVLALPNPVSPKANLSATFR